MLAFLVVCALLLLVLRVFAGRRPLKANLSPLLTFHNVFAACSVVFAAVLLLFGTIAAVCAACCCSSGLLLLVRLVLSFVCCLSRFCCPFWVADR